MKILFKNRSFVVVWLSQAASGFGHTFSVFIISWLVYDLTGSKLDMGGIWVAFMLPNIIVQILIGPFLDRWNRRLAMVFSQWIRAAAFLAPAVLYPTGLIEVWHLYLVTIVSGLAEPLFRPAGMAFVAEILPREQLMRGNSILEGTAQTLMLAGPALGGLMVTVLGASSVLYSLLIILFMAGFLLCFIPGGSASMQSELKQKGWLGRFKEGLQFFRLYPVLFWVGIVLMVNNFSFGAAQPMFLPFVMEYLKGDALQYGLFTSSFSMGMLAGSLITGLTREPLNRRRVMLGSLFASGLLLSSLGWITTFPPAMSAVIAMGFFAMIFTINNTTFYQRRVPRELRGRVFSIRILLAQAGAPLGAALGSVAAEFWGLTVLFTGLGALSALTTLAAWRSPIFHHLNDAHPIAETQETSP